MCWKMAEWVTKILKRHKESNIWKTEEMAFIGIVFSLETWVLVHK